MDLEGPLRGTGVGLFHFEDTLAGRSIGPLQKQENSPAPMKTTRVRHRGLANYLVGGD